MNHLIWETPEARLGPQSNYGMWEGAKAFNIFDCGGMKPKGYTGPRYKIVTNLSGFRKDLPLQHDVETAKAFCERLLTRWVAKRGLLFKAHIVVTDAMREAAFKAIFPDGSGREGDNVLIDNPCVVRMVEAALKARG